MSDSYEGRDRKYDDDSGRRLRRERDARLGRYEDDAWGMAHYGDLSDGAQADIEDWAAGMVDEEGRRYREERRNQRNNETMNLNDDLGGVDRPELSGENFPPRGSGQRRYEDSGESSALNRADRLRERLYRGAQTRGHVEGQDRLRVIEDDQRKQKPRGGGGDFFDRLFDFKVDSWPETISSVVIIVIIAVLLISLACVGGAWLTAEELVRVLELK